MTFGSGTNKVKQTYSSKKKKKSNLLIVHSFILVCFACTDKWMTCSELCSLGCLACCYHLTAYTPIIEKKRDDSPSHSPHHHHHHVALDCIICFYFFRKILFIFRLFARIRNDKRIVYQLSFALYHRISENSIMFNSRISGLDFTTT